MIPAVRRAVTCATRYDPTTFLVGMGGWAILNGIALLLPGDVFAAAPIYAALRVLPIGENEWGALLILDGALLLGSISYRVLPLRAAVAILSGALWLFFGCMLLAGGAMRDIFSAGGAWSVFAGVGCWLAAVQWVAVKEAA